MLFARQSQPYSPTTHQGEFMIKVLEMAGDVEEIELSFHGEESSYFEPTAARCSSSSTCTCCCTG